MTNYNTSTLQVFTSTIRYSIAVEFNGMLSRLADLTSINMDAMRADAMSWNDQFRNAMNVNGGDLENATSGDYIMHFLTFGWKVSTAEFISS